MNPQILRNTNKNWKLLRINRRKAGDVILTDHGGIYVTVVTKKFFLSFIHFICVTFLGYFGQIILWVVDNIYTMHEWHIRISWGRQEMYYPESQYYYFLELKIMKSNKYKYFEFKNTAIQIIFHIKKRIYAFNVKYIFTKTFWT